MPLQADILKQLLATFKVELDERLQSISDGLLLLEKKPKKEDAQKTIEEIFRAAHNIKGSARSVGLDDIGQIVHHLESMFAEKKTKIRPLSLSEINLCFEAVDAIKALMQAFEKKKQPDFPLEKLLARLSQAGSKSKAQRSASIKAPKPKGLPKLAEAVLSTEGKTALQESHEHDSIRVALPQIDAISALVEQMQINKIGLEDHHQDLFKLAAKLQQILQSPGLNLELLKELSYAFLQGNKSMQSAIKEFERIANGLQEEMQRLRLVPASTLLRHLTRLVRDLALELHKNIAFEILGEQVKLDKIILDGLKDPLIHLLRNAIDHGIESPELRKKQGKAEEGKITLEVRDEGDHILIEVRDDGAGIDVKKIMSTALKKKLLTQQELNHLSEQEIMDLIFRPEFSTQDIITNISGRGVGLDVVKSALSDLKGSLSFSSEWGLGTCFHLRLPLTLSSDIGLTIKSGGQLFVLSVGAIERVLMLKASLVREVEATQTIFFEGQTLPLVVLADILNLDSQELLHQDSLPILILQKGSLKLAMLVEEILSEREIVIKPLQFPLSKVPCVAGGTLSGTGEVIIVLNPYDLMKEAMRAGKSRRIDFQGENLNVKAEQHHILLAEDSITTRTLEKNVLESNDYKVTVAVDGKEAWDLLQKQSFSLLITDIEMPQMDGFELTQRIRQSDKYRELPIIIVTSLDSEENKRRGIEAGANAYIMKHDFESSELLEIVGQLV